MGAVETIKARLSKHPALRYTERSNGIQVHPADDSGFTVSLVVRRAGFSVYFDGWHEEFTSEEDALNCVAFGLSTSCRLAVVMRGNLATKWTVEGWRDGTWTRDSETGLVFQPFWRSSRVVYRQNRLPL